VVVLVALALALLGVGCRSTTAASVAPSAAATPATKAGGAAVAPRPGDAAAPEAGDSVDAERERIAARASWAPGSLASHVEKHGREGPYRSAAEYDAAARATIRDGAAFRYQDRESDAERLGFYDKAGNRFTGVTRDGRRITTHFRPDRGEAYVRGLERSTYR